MYKTFRNGDETGFEPSKFVFVFLLFHGIARKTCRYRVSGLSNRVATLKRTEQDLIEN